MLKVHTHHFNVAPLRVVAGETPLDCSLFLTRPVYSLVTAIAVQGSRLHGDLDHRGGAVVLYLLDRVVIGEVQGGRGMKARENGVQGREGGTGRRKREGERERGATEQ